MVIRSSLLAFSLALGIGFLAGPAVAGPAVTLDNPQRARPLGSRPASPQGFTFSTGGPITVTDLGVFDDAQDGLIDRHAVGLWDSGGNLLASTTLGAGTVDPLTNQFRYASIAPVNLLAGTYTIGAVWLDGNDALIFPGEATNFATASGITFLDDEFVSGGSLADPTSSASAEPSYFGPNFQFTAAAVPEPLTLSIFGAGLAGLGMARRRKKAV